MKRFQNFIPYVITMYGMFFCSFVYPQSKNEAPYIKFKETKYDFGIVQQGKVVKIEYFFENTGKSPLVISDIEVSCGCTVADFPHYPIKPGDTGMILITFNTKEKFDKQNRAVSVISNAANSPAKLHFKGEIKTNG